MVRKISIAMRLEFTDGSHQVRPDFPEELDVIGWARIGDDRYGAWDIEFSRDLTATELAILTGAGAKVYGTGEVLARVRDAGIKEARPAVEL